MRTFKLIEEYYGSPKLGTIIREDNLDQLVSEQIEIFKLDEILKFTKHWQEFDEIDYTGTRFKFHLCPGIEYYILSKDFEKYRISWSYGNATSQCKISEVHQYFERGEYIKIEEPKYVIGFDAACENGDYSVIFKIKEGVAEVIKQEKIKKIIMTTFDGANLYSGDKVHIVYPNTSVILNCDVYEDMKKNRTSGCKFFKDSEKAYEWRDVIIKYKELFKNSMC